MEKEKLNVLMVPPASAAFVRGGVRTQVLQTAHGLRSLGASVEFISPDMSFDPRRFDVIHLFQAGYEMLSVSRVLSGDTATPVVLSPVLYSRHSPAKVRQMLQVEEKCSRWLWGLTSEMKIKKDVCKRVRLLLPNTPAEAAFLREAFGISEDRIRWVPNGVESRFAKADSQLFEQETGLSHVTLFVGDVTSRRKNLLEVLRNYRANEVIRGASGRRKPDGVSSGGRYAPPPLVLIGSTDGGGSYGEACRRAIRENPDVIALGPLPQSSPLLASAYAAADVFLMPSLFETPGIAAMEAGLAGAVVVITAHGGTEDVFKNHAIYVEPHQTDAILEGVSKAYAIAGNINDGIHENQLRPDVLRDHLLSHYTWQEVARQTLDAYNNVR